MSNKSYSGMLLPDGIKLYVDSTYVVVAYNCIEDQIKKNAGSEYNKCFYIKTMDEIVLDSKNHGKKSIDKYKKVIAIDCDNVEKTIHPKHNSPSADLCIGVTNSSSAQEYYDKTHSNKNKSQLLFVELKLDAVTGHGIKIRELYDKFKFSKDYYLSNIDNAKCCQKMIVVCSDQNIEKIRRHLNSEQKASGQYLEKIGYVTTLKKFSESLILDD